MNYLLIEHADEEWDLPIPDYKAELAADQAWTLFDQAMDKLALAINLSQLPEYVDHEPRHIASAWNKVMKFQTNLIHELHEAGWSFSRLRLEVPIEMLEEERERNETQD
jgi:hypothetical protein